MNALYAYTNFISSFCGSKSGAPASIALNDIVSCTSQKQVWVVALFPLTLTNGTAKKGCLGLLSNMIGCLVGSCIITWLSAEASNEIILWFWSAWASLIFPLQWALSGCKHTLSCCSPFLIRSIKITSGGFFDAIGFWSSLFLQHSLYFLPEPQGHSSSSCKYNCSLGISNSRIDEYITFASLLIIESTFIFTFHKNRLNPMYFSFC